MKRVLKSSTIFKYCTLLLVHVIPLNCSSEQSMLILNNGTVCWQVWNYLDIFLVSPGGGRDYTYSPAGVNATLECTVSSNDLSWEIDKLRFESYNSILNERGIFQSKQTASTDLSSVLLVFGNMAENNGSKVCCETLVRRSLVDICTTRIIYGKEQNYHNIMLLSWISTEEFSCS